MLGTGLSLTLFTRNCFILTQDNMDNLVTNFNSGVERAFPDILVSTIVLSTAVLIPTLCHSQFYSFHFSALEFSC